MIQIANRFLIGETWHKVQRVYTAKRDLPVGKSAFSFQFGFNPQTFEIGGLSLYNYGPDIASDVLPSVKPKLYNGHEDDAPWRDVAAKRIEQIRKADMNITAVKSTAKGLVLIIDRGDVKRRQRARAFSFLTGEHLITTFFSF